MGCFDGVHIGHQKVISTAVEQAEPLSGEAWVYTFKPHPAKVLVPEKAPPLISAEPCRIRQIAALGINGIIETPFTQKFAQLSPEAFLSDLCARVPSLKAIVCGQDWSFGYRAAGNIQTLKAFGKQHGFSATAVSPVMHGEQKISSTTIRNAISNGNISLAKKLLGRPFTLFGNVVEGEKVGRELGFPTANINPKNELLPGNGVYAAYTKVQSSEQKNGAPETENSKPPTVSIPSAVFIGTRDTFGCPQHVIESHLINFTGDLYGKPLEVVLIEKIRDIIPFPSPKALAKQINRDIEKIQQTL